MRRQQGRPVCFKRLKSAARSPVLRARAWRRRRRTSKKRAVPIGTSKPKCISPTPLMRSQGCLDRSRFQAPLCLYVFLQNSATRVTCRLIPSAPWALRSTPLTHPLCFAVFGFRLQPTSRKVRPGVRGEPASEREDGARPVKRQMTAGREASGMALVQQ